MIRVYNAKITDYFQADYAKMYSLLECAIRDKIDKKTNEKGKQQSLLGYILLYNGVFELYQKSGFKIEFNEYGKPLCDFCYFSISHSDERVVCAISDQPIGVDIQKISNIIKRKKYKFFNEKETVYVNQENGCLSEKYIEIFTKKEAAVKMLGLSLSKSNEIDTFSDKFVFNMESFEDYIVAVCSPNVPIM